MKQKPLTIEVFAGIAFFVELSVLAFLAVTEKSISIGGPKSGGVGYASGTNAIWLGLALFALAVAALAYALRYTKYKLLYWTFLFLVWLGLVLWQLTVGF